MAAREGNPFTNLLKLMKDQGYNKDSQVLIGSVKATSPLTIDVNGFDIEDGDFYLTERMNQLSPALAVNDFLLILVDKNEFFILDRVVK